MKFSILSTFVAVVLSENVNAQRVVVTGTPANSSFVATATLANSSFVATATLANSSFVATATFANSSFVFPASSSTAFPANGSAVYGGTATLASPIPASSCIVFVNGTGLPTTVPFSVIIAVQARLALRKPQKPGTPVAYRQHSPFPQQHAYGSPANITSILATIYTTALGEVTTVYPSSFAGVPSSLPLCGGPINGTASSVLASQSGPVGTITSTSAANTSLPDTVNGLGTNKSGASTLKNGIAAVVLSTVAGIAMVAL
ncbi:hypothetical protein BDZ97DRAFT_1922259 [Flammula alnicola]|nr:hypothetical protein BDZ97DRAFT_1922259 [Flammula alnicola]